MTVPAARLFPALALLAAAGLILIQPRTGSALLLGVVLVDAAVRYASERRRFAAAVAGAGALQAVVLICPTNLIPAMAWGIATLAVGTCVWHRTSVTVRASEDLSDPYTILLTVEDDIQK